MILAEQKLTAAQIILLAADDLTTAGNLEFSEWDLTVASWNRDKNRFGLRGYAQTYPDHKRVMMEIMGQKPANPVVLKYIEKVRPNYYRLTPLGKSTAARLRAGGTAKLPAGPGRQASKPVTVKDLYDLAASYLGRAEFRRWRDNPEEPRDWTDAASFLGINIREATATVSPHEKLEEARNGIRAAVDWCTVQEAVFLTRGTGQAGSPIHVRDLAELLDFLQALEYRFPEYLDPNSPRAKKRRID